MRHTILPFYIAALAAAVAAAQTPPGNVTQQAPSAQTSDTRAAQGDAAKQPRSTQRSHQSKSRPDSQASAKETRPDANYPSPSGQDSHPENSSHRTRLAGGESKPTNGTADNRGAKAADQSRPVRKLNERKAYTGSSGSKADPGTACSTARPTQNGGVDCGTTGNSATEGKLVTKPR